MDLKLVLFYLKFPQLSDVTKKFSDKSCTFFITVVANFIIGVIEYAMDVTKKKNKVCVNSNFLLVVGKARTRQLLACSLHALTVLIHQSPQFLSIGCADLIIQNGLSEAHMVHYWSYAHTAIQFLSISCSDLIHNRSREAFEVHSFHSVVILKDEIFFSKNFGSKKNQLYRNKEKSIGNSLNCVKLKVSSHFKLLQKMRETSIHLGFVSVLINHRKYNLIVKRITM